ncbi:MAG TPA: right-handed parallel beta-helix repeat-containing protein, partial [Gemmatimonadaceae bacterium]
KSNSATIAVTGSTSGPTPPPPAPAPPPPAPAPPPVGQTACSQYPHSRLVPVSTSAALHSALSSAQPGDLIQLADGTYGDGSEFRLLASGTASQRITVCGTSNAVINAGSMGRDGMKLSGANYATLSGFTITNGLFGVWVEHSVHVMLQGLTVHGIGQEGIEIVAFSKNAVVSNNRIYDTGRVVAEYGEAIYIGSTYGHWAQTTGGAPDATDSVLIEGNNIGPDVRAEHIDAKEGTTGGIIRNNTFNGAGMVESQGSGISGWPNSWVILQGVGYRVENNTGSNALAAGFRVVTHGTVMTGLNNSFSNNSFDVNGAPYGFLIQTGSGSNGNGNAVSCDNSVRDASQGLANVACR